MKRIVLALLAVTFLFVTVAYAADVWIPPRTGPYAQELSLTADASGTALSDKFIGRHLTQIEMKTTTDTEITFSISSAKGTTLFTRTTTAANSGEIKYPNAYYLITHQPTYTLSGLAAGDTAVIVVSSE